MGSPGRCPQESPLKPRARAKLAIGAGLAIVLALSPASGAFPSGVSTVREGTGWAAVKFTASGHVRLEASAFDAYLTAVAAVYLFTDELEFVIGARSVLTEQTLNSHAEVIPPGGGPLRVEFWPSSPSPAGVTAGLDLTSLDGTYHALFLAAGEAERWEYGITGSGLQTVHGVREGAESFLYSQHEFHGLATAEVNAAPVGLHVEAAASVDANLDRPLVGEFALADFVGVAPAAMVMRVHANGVSTECPCEFLAPLNTPIGSYRFELSGIAVQALSVGEVLLFFALPVFPP